MQSVLNQDYADWEIVVSDNASKADVRGYIEGLNDKRVKYLRSDAFLPVTENWNRALEASSGDYFIMLGDDDCLLEGCLSIAAALLKKHECPDVLYTEAIQYAYPGVIPGLEEGFVQTGYCEFMKGKDEPFLLDRAAASGVVAQALSFRVAYSYNMQHSIISRRLVDGLKKYGRFFQSPYPDYYATNAILLMSSRILVCPWPLVGIGISPKSFGYFYFNQREKEGIEFLQNVAEPSIFSRVSDKVLSGSEMNTSWLLAMESLKNNFPEEIPVDVAYNKYRFMQFRELLRTSGSSRVLFLESRNKGNFKEQLFWGMIAAMYGVSAVMPFKNFWRRYLLRALHFLRPSHPRVDSTRRPVRSKNLLELTQEEGGIRTVPPTWRRKLNLTGLP